MNKQKFGYHDTVLWLNPSSNSKERARVVKCCADDPIEPFYMIEILSTHRYTHAFERSLESYEEPAQKPKK